MSDEKKRVQFGSVILKALGENTRKKRIKIYASIKKMEL